MLCTCPQGPDNDANGFPDKDLSYCNCEILWAFIVCVCLCENVLILLRIKIPYSHLSGLSFPEWKKCKENICCQLLCEGVISSSGHCLYAVLASLYGISIVCVLTFLICSYMLKYNMRLFEANGGGALHLQCLMFCIRDMNWQFWQHLNHFVNLVLKKLSFRHAGSHNVNFILNCGPGFNLVTVMRLCFGADPGLVQRSGCTWYTQVPRMWPQIIQLSY